MEVLRSTGLARHRIQNWSLRSGSVIFQFDVTSSEHSYDGMYH